MHSTRQVPINQTESMTLPIIAPTTGIAIQSSAPLYSQKQHDHPVEKVKLRSCFSFISKQQTLVSNSQRSNSQCTRAFFERANTRTSCSL